MKGDRGQGSKGEPQARTVNEENVESVQRLQINAMAHQKGTVKDTTTETQTQKFVPHKTGPSAATSKKQQMIKRLMKANTKKITARKTAPTANKLKPIKSNGRLNSYKKNVLPVKFDFRRIAQDDIEKCQFVVRKGADRNFNKFSSGTVGKGKAPVTLMQNGVPSSLELTDNLTESAPTPEKSKSLSSAGKGYSVSKTPVKTAESPQNLPKRPHQVRFANNRGGRVKGKDSGYSFFEIKKSLKRNGEALENSQAAKVLKSSPLKVPSGVQRAVMLGLVSASSLYPGMTQPRQVNAKPGICEKGTKPTFKELTPKGAKNNPDKMQHHVPLRHIYRPSEEDKNQGIQTKKDCDTGFHAECPKSSQMGHQDDIFTDEEPPTLISSTDLETQSISSRDETPTLERQPSLKVASFESSQPLLTSGKNQASSDRDNPTPIPGTTASSSNPPHTLSADLPVGAEGSATPDSSATGTCPSEPIKKKKPQPRIKTHFGMKRHRTGRVINKPSSYDSDSTDVQSETWSEVQVPGQKKRRSGSTSTVTSLETDSDYMAHGTLTGHIGNNLQLQSELPLCCCRMEQKGPSSVILSTCRALEVVNNELVECKNKISVGKLHRPSSRVPYGAFCPEHRTQMTEHKCCPGCGCFCTTGVIIICDPDGRPGKSHHFHRECIVDMAGGLYCPHCGNTSDLREISIPSNGNLATFSKVPESVIMSGVVKLPKTLLEKLTGCSEAEQPVDIESHLDIHLGPRAKMSLTKNDKPDLPNEEEENANLESKSITLKSGKTVTSKPCPVGPGREVLESVMEYLNSESPKRTRFFPKNMYMAASQGDMGKVLQMLVDGFDPNYRFPAHNLETTLHPAASEGRLEIIMMLLQAGANLDAENKDHRTPLQVAVENNHNDCMKYLIKHGAAVEHKDKDKMKILHIAAKNGNLEAVKHILNLRKINSNAQDDGGWTPIIWAAEYKHIPVVQYLMDRGADPKIRDKEGNSGLHWAVYSGTEDVAEIFLNSHCDVEAPNIHGDTPLHIAARENHYGCVMMLLLRNASIEVTNQEGETPLDCAKADSEVALALQVHQKMKLAINNRSIRSEMIIGRDIARGLEALPIPVVNAVNDDPIPTDFHYVTKSCETASLNINHSITKPPMCTCSTKDCSTDACECANNSVRCWYDSDGRLFPDFDYQEPPLIFECGPGCKCWRTCRNRVVQNGIRCHMQLYRTTKIGWGVRVTQDVPQGTFICEYAGELISDAEADKREDDSYLFDLDNEEREVYCIDARHYGNISRFINHLCDPNIVPVRVFIEHRDISFPRIAFFASRNIKAQEELGFDYGDKFWAIKSKFFMCSCGSVHCKHAESSTPASEQGDQDC